MRYGKEQRIKTAERLKALRICEHFYKGHCSRFDDGCFHQCQAEPKAGEWIDVENEPYCECSVCGAYIDNLDDDYAFCPRCGADMRGEEE